MSLIRIVAAAVLLLLSACATPPPEIARLPSILIDQPVPPFPYNSLICP